MGLLLSVLVVCVGVLEVIACVRHFQDGYLPLWTPHCAVTSGFAITHDRWRKLPSFDYAKNDDEKHFEDLTGAKNGTVTLGLQDGCVESVEKFGKTLHCDASLQDDQKVVSEVNLQESEATFVAQKLSDSVASANEPEDKIVNFTSDIHKQTVTDVFQSDIYNNNLVQTEHNLEEVITFHTQDSSITSEQDIQTNCEAPDKKAELIQQPPKDIPDDSLKHVEENEDNDTHETTVVGTPHHEETTHITEDNDFESDSRLEPQTSSSDAEVIRSADIDTQPQDEPDAEVKSEETPEELIETLKKTPSPVRISPPISTPPLTPKKSKADISWPTFFPGAPVIKRPSVSFATPEALLAGEDPEPRLRNDEEERPATPPPIIKRSKENTPVPSDVESRSISSESLGEDVDQEEEDNEDQSLFSGIRDKSPTSIISGNDFSKKELELQRRKSYKLKRFNSAVETVSRDEQTEDRSFSEDKKGVSHAVKSREPKRKLKKPVKATSFEDAMLRDIRDGDVVEGGTTLKLGKEVKFVDEPAVVAEEEEILLEQEAQTPQEESKLKTDEGLKVSFGQVELEPEKFVVDDEESQFEKNHFAEQKEQVISEQKIFDDSEDIQASPDERLKEELNQEQCSAVRKPADENQDGVINQIKDDEVPKTESGGQSNKEDEIHQHVLGEKSMGMQNTSQVHSKSIEVKSSEELTTRIDSKQSEERKDDVPSPKEVETLKNNSEMHSKSTQSKSSDQSTTKFDSNQSEEKLGDKQLSKEEEEEEEEEEIVEWIEEEIILDDSEVPSRAMENNRSNEISTKLDPRQNEEKSHTKQVVAEEQEEEEVEEEEEEIEEEEEEEAMIVNNSKVHSKAVEIKSSDEMSTKTGTKQDEEEGKGYQRVTEEVEEEELVEEEEQKLEQEPIVVLDKSKVHSKAIEIKSSDEMSTKTGTKQDEEEGNGNQRVTEEVEEEEEEELVEEEEQELEQEPIVVLDKSKVHSKAIEIKSSDEMSIKTDSKQDDRKGETKSADAEQEKDVVMVDNSEVHSKAVKIKTNEEISNKTKQHGEELVIDASKVHSKPAETKSSDETTTKVLAREPEEEDEGLGIEEKTSAMKVSDEQEKGLTREEKCSTMKVCDEGQQQRQSGVRFAEPEREEEEDSSSYTLSESTQQKTPPKEAFWLIFSGEYTKAMSKDWHSGHFCCWQCDESLTGQRYVLRDDHPYCIKCYESVFANTCEECSKIIGIDSKDLSYKDKHWHEACFLCNKCRVSLVDKQFGSKADKIYCGNCYDSQFASRCDGCGEIFRAGTKKMEYKTRQWHEKCFCCCVCKTPIGTKSFIPREQEIYCATCYEEKFATRCVKCNKIITSGGVTYKNEPWHRECFTCTHCNTSLAGQRFTSRDEKPYCADCFGELFAKRCTSCSRPITGIGGTRFISFEDRHWHNDCFICASCKTSLVGRGFITDGDDIICPECAKQKLM